MRSVVVELKNDFAAVLSDDGRILKVKNKNYVLGQVIVMKKQKIHFNKKIALLVASAAVVLLSGGVGAWAYTTPYSYVSLDVNPSIEYTLNRFDRVIDVNAVNDDGKEILDELDVDSLYNQKIEDALLDTVTQISTEGYFSSNAAEVATDSAIVVTTGSAIETVATTAIELATDSAVKVTTDSAVEVATDSAIVVTSGSGINIDGGIVITVSNENGEKSEELVKEIGEAITEHVGENVIVEVYSVGYERVQEARKLGVTPGKLNLVEKLQASAADPSSIVIEEWLKKPVKDIMKATKENRKLSLGETSQTTPETDNEEDSMNQNTGVTVSSQSAIVLDQAEEAQRKADEKAQEAQLKAEEKAQEAQLKAEEKERKAEEKALEEQKKTEEAKKKEDEKALEKQKKEEEAKKKAEEKALEAQKKAEEKALEAQKKAEEKALEAQKKSEEAQSIQKKNNDKNDEIQNNSNKPSNSSNGKGKN